jgi:starch synthase
MAPWVKTGGLGDVAAALPAALHQEKHDIRVLLPAYRALLQAFPDALELAAFPALAPALPPARLLAADAGGLPLILLDCPELFDRPGNPYLDALGHDRQRHPLRAAVPRRRPAWPASFAARLATRRGARQ